MRGEFKVQNLPRRPLSRRAAIKGSCAECAAIQRVLYTILLKQTNRDDGKWKAEQEKYRSEEAIANATGLCVLAAISAAVPVRQMKRDLLFIAEWVASLLDQNRLTVLARRHDIKKAKDNDSTVRIPPLI